MHKLKKAYIIRSSIPVGGSIFLCIVATLKVASANQLPLTTKAIIIAVPWVILIYIIYILVVYYKKLDDYDLDSDDVPWLKKGSDKSK